MRIVTKVEQILRLATRYGITSEQARAEVVMTCDQCSKDVNMVAVFNPQSVEPLSLCHECIAEAYIALVAVLQTPE